jgi:NADH-quinone oxidoreductase subunit C
MSAAIQALAGQLEERFGDAAELTTGAVGQLTLEVSTGRLLEVCTALRDNDEFAFEMLVDLCGVDYLTYGQAEWKTATATASGFSRGVQPVTGEAPASRRFAVVYHLLSISRNQRLRVRTFAPGVEPPLVPSVIDIWPSANWYEREAFDLFGILFDGHPDLRRILTDYGFIGHPFRKDFPLIGNVEVRYDPDRGRVVYQPVSIAPRTLVARVIRGDTRPPTDNGSEHG